MLNCTCCKKPSESHKTVNCFICSKPYKIDCVNVSSAEARKIHSGTGFSWTCKDCSKYGNDLAGLKAVISGLQDEVRALKNSILDSPASTSSTLIETEKIIQEINERSKRKNNIVIFGSNETQCGTNAEQLGVDRALVTEICSVAQVFDENLKLSRLGKFDPTSVDSRRPIKVSFTSEVHVTSVLRNISKIKSKFPGVSIFCDRTPMQLQIHKDAKTELAERVNNGESNLKIKYKNGIPSIISTLN